VNKATLGYTDLLMCYTCLLNQFVADSWGFPKIGCLVLFLRKDELKVYCDEPVTDPGMVIRGMNHGWICFFNLLAGVVEESLANLCSIVSDADVTEMMRCYDDLRKQALS
jgi:hypothetical protein